MRIRSLLMPAVALALASGACATNATRDDEPPRLVRTVVIDDLRSPWSLAFLSATEALISEKEGELLKVDLSTGDREPIAGLPADLVDDIRSQTRADNGGLFDVALHPDFDVTPWVYLSYAAKSDQGRTTKVIRARLDQSELKDHETLLVATPFTEDEFFHYGGGLSFGADGKLYITIGERLFRETDGPELPIAQDVSDKRGKIYRLNPDGSAPIDNPDFGSTAPKGVFALGIRAAQGITLEPETGAMWFSEHGSRQGDEVNRLVAGANYGWPIVTDGGYRDESYEPPVLENRSFTAPMWSWPQTVAPTGLVFYHGDEFPAWRGDLFVSGLSRGGLWRLNIEDGVVRSVEELFVDDRIRSRDVAVSPDGALYQLTDTLLRTNSDGRLEFTGEPSGRLLRISRDAPRR